MVLCPDLTSQVEAADIAARLHDVLSPPVPVAGHALRVAASVGIALGPLANAEDALQQADIAMYRAKNSGGDCRGSAARAPCPGPARWSWSSSPRSAW